MACSVGDKFPLPAAINKAVESVVSVVRREKSFLPFRTSSAEALARFLRIVCVCCYCSPSSAAQQPSAMKPLRSPHTPRAPRARMTDAYPSHPLAPYGGATMDEPISPPHHLELLAAFTASPVSNTSDGRFKIDISHVNYSKAISEESNTSCGNDSNFPDPSGNPPHFQHQPKPQHQLLQQKVGAYSQLECCPKKRHVHHQHQQQQQGPGPSPPYNPLYLHNGNGGSGPGGAGGRGAGPRPPDYNPLHLHGSNGGSGPGGPGGRGAGRASRMIPTQNGNCNGSPYHQGGRGGGRGGGYDPAPHMRSPQASFDFDCCDSPPACQNFGPAGPPL
eukprot:gene18787-25328_t